MENRNLNTGIMRFKEFIQSGNMGEEKKDISHMLTKLPPAHRDLVKGWQWKFHAGNTLNGDDEHVGYMDDAGKEIAVAAPWNYGREFTILHEIGHKVWENLVSPQLKQEWLQVVQHKTPKQMHDKTLMQEPEELFCMSYAQHFASNKIEKFDNPLWQRFIKKVL